MYIFFIYIFVSFRKTYVYTHTYIYTYINDCIYTH